MIEITFKELVDALSTLQNVSVTIERGEVIQLILKEMKDLLKKDKIIPSCVIEE